MFRNRYGAALLRERKGERKREGEGG